jgi:hypothetical protein
MPNNKDNGNNDRENENSRGSKYDEMAGTQGSGDKAVDKKYEEAQDQANRDRREQQGEDD